jgi:hypothetical protein
MHPQCLGYVRWLLCGNSVNDCFWPTPEIPLQNVDMRKPGLSLWENHQPQSSTPMPVSLGLTITQLT